MNGFSLGFFLASVSTSNVDINLSNDVIKIFDAEESSKNLNSNGKLASVHESTSEIKHNKKNKLNLDSNFEKIGTEGRKMVRCKICYIHQQTVLINCKQKKSYSSYLHRFRYLGQDV